MHRIARLTAKLAALAPLAAAGVIAGAGAASAAPTWQDGNAQFVSAVAGPCTGQISSGTFTSVLQPNAGQAPAAGTRFHLRVIVSDVSTCGTTAGLSLRLPAGISLATSASFPVRCFRYDSSNLANITTFTGTSSCPSAPSTVNGFLVLNPPGFAGWALRPSADPAENQVEIQVPVIASTAGSFTTRARVCDVAGPGCTAVSPPGNVEATVSFTVVAPPASVTNASPFVTATTPTTISTRATVNAPTSGTVVAELVDGATLGSPGTTILESESASLPAGTGFQIDVTYDTAVLPGRFYYARTCFTPSGGSKVCGAQQRVQGGIPTHQVATNAATSIARTAATVGGSVTGPRVDGQLIVKYGTTTSYGHTVNAGAASSAARSGTATRSTTITGLTPNTTYHYIACYRFTSGNIIRDHCGLDRVFTTVP